MRGKLTAPDAAEKNNAGHSPSENRPAAVIISKLA
jgi:hypothetical protein